MAVYIERTGVDQDSAPHLLWDNELLSATLTPSTEATNGDVENLLEDSTWDFWTLTAATGTLGVSFSGNTTLSAIGIASHNLGSQNATISLDETSGTPAQLFEISPVDDSTILVLFDSTTSNNFTFRITAADNPVSIGSMFLGQPLIVDTGILAGYTPLWMADETELLESMSLSGQFFQNRVVKRSASTDVNFNILERSFVEGAAFQGFRSHFNDGKTFYFAAGPSVFEDDVSYCRRTVGSTIRPSFPQSGSFYSVSLGLEAFVG